MLLLGYKQFFRSRATIFGICFILAVGILSLYVGKHFISKQQQNIYAAAMLQQQQIQRNVQYFNTDIGLLLYYLKFALIDKPDNFSALAIGQRDINSSIQNVTIRNLEGQKYDTDLNNPYHLLIGNLDFGFVVLYLFPLLIIAFTYNVLSEEREAERLKLLSIQSKSTLQLIFQKFLVCSSVIVAIFFLLIVVAIVILSLPFTYQLVVITAILFTYILFWLCLSFWVISWQQKSSINAISLLCFWIILTIVSPALVNNYIIYKYPVPEALRTVVAQREGYHEKWDIDKKLTMAKFYSHYPQFKNYVLPDKEFSWLWYYAMQQMGDDDAKQQTELLKLKLLQREKVSNLIGCFIPTLHTQLQLNTVTASGLNNYLQFLDSTAAFHQKLRLYFYPKIFTEQPVKNENWQAFTVTYFKPKAALNFVTMLLPLLITILVLLVASLLNYKKGLKH